VRAEVARPARRKPRAMAVRARRGRAGEKGAAIRRRARVRRPPLPCPDFEPGHGWGFKAVRAPETRRAAVLSARAAGAAAPPHCSQARPRRSGKGGSHARPGPPRPASPPARRTREPSSRQRRGGRREGGRVAPPRRGGRLLPAARTREGGRRASVSGRTRPPHLDRALHAARDLLTWRHAPTRTHLSLAYTCRARKPGVARRKSRARQPEKKAPPRGRTARRVRPRPPSEKKTRTHAPNECGRPCRPWARWGRSASRRPAGPGGRPAALGRAAGRARRPSSWRRTWSRWRWLPSAPPARVRRRRRRRRRAGARVRRRRSVAARPGVRHWHVRTGGAASRAGTVYACGAGAGARQAFSGREALRESGGPPAVRGTHTRRQMKNARMSARLFP
jgi:hypothetical protein